MGINSLLQPYEGGILLGLLISVIYLIISHRTLKQSIERHDTEQRELRGMVTGLIQSIGDFKSEINQSIGDFKSEVNKSIEAMRGDIKVLKERQQDQTDNKQTSPDGST